MSQTVEEVSKITSKGQTTVPRAVRRALGVAAGDSILFRVGQDGVTVERAADDPDPAVDSFLIFLARDIQARPEAIQALDPDLSARIAALTGPSDGDPDAAIVGDVAL